MPSRWQLPAILLAGLLLPGAGCQYLVIVDTLNANIVFAFSGGHPHAAAPGASVRVVNAQKAAVRSLVVADSTAAGDSSATLVPWDRCDDAGRRVPAGSYSARLYVDGVVVEESKPVYVSSP